MLVTGSSGFLGRVTVPALVRRGPAAVAVWDRAVHGDLRDPTAVSAALSALRPTVVLHLAWESTAAAGYDRDARNADWCEVTRHLAAACWARGVHIVGVGSGIEVTAGPSGRTPYALAKRATLAGLRAGVPPRGWTWARPFWIFSAPDRRPRLLADALAADQPFRPRTPDARLDFVEVRDVAEALALLAMRAPGGVVDIGGGRARTVAELLSAHGVVTAAAGPPLARAVRGPAVPMANIGRLLRWGWTPQWTTRLFSGGERLAEAR